MPACPMNSAPTAFWESGGPPAASTPMEVFQLAGPAPPAVPVGQPGEAPTSSAAMTWPAILAETGHPSDSRRSVSLMVDDRYLKACISPRLSAAGSVRAEC